MGKRLEQVISKRGKHKDLTSLGTRKRKNKNHNMIPEKTLPECLQCKIGVPNKGKDMNQLAFSYMSGGSLT